MEAVDDLHHRKHGGGETTLLRDVLGGARNDRRAPLVDDLAKRARKWDLG
jgi:hypothetical protein